MRERLRGSGAIGLRSGLVLSALLILIAVVAPLSLDSAAMTLTADVRASPSLLHPLGTDEFGRDLLARTLVATRLTLVMTVSATIISVIVGVIVGTGVWLLGGRARNLVLRLIEAAVSFPTLALALVVATILGPGSVQAVIAIGIANIPAFARMAANLTSTVAGQDYVWTARLLGVPRLRVLGRHLVPNIAEPLLILSASSFALTLVELSALSFLGLGVQSPQFDFGKLLSDGLASIFVQPSQIVGPSAMIIVTGLAAILIGDGLAALSDPRTRSTGRASGWNRRSRPSSDAHSASASQSAVSAPPLAVIEGLRIETESGAVLVGGVSFTVSPGEIVGLVGESGSGKSLTAMALAGLLSDGLVTTATRLEFRGQDMLGGVDSRRLATELGLIYQDPSTTFAPTLTLGGQLTEVLRTHKNLKRSSASRVIRSSLVDIGIADPDRLLRARSDELSGGMLQRSMIAAATAAGAELLIADEPTTALDVTVQLSVLREFRRLNRDHGTAMLFISHDIGVVQSLCNRILVMRGGLLVEELTAAELAAGDVSHPYTASLLAAMPAAPPTPEAVLSPAHHVENTGVEEGVAP